MKKKDQSHKVSDHIYSTIQNHFQEIGMQHSLVDSYHKARPKSYPQVFRKLFVLSKYSRQLFHLFSLLIALSFGYNLMIWAFGAMGVPSIHWSIPLLTAVAVLGLFERFQDVTLDCTFEMYFQTKQHSPTLITLSAFFSIISLVTSVYSARELSQFSNYSYAFVALSFLVELLIIGTSYFIHSYHHKSALTVSFYNDISSTKTGLNNSVPTTTTGKAEQAPKAAKTTAKKQASILFTNSAPTKQTAKKVWKKTDVKGERNRYAKRLKEKETLPRKEQSFFFDYVYKNWSDLQSGGVVPVVPNAVRKEFYKSKNPDLLKKYINS